MSQTSKIAILMATYNGEKYLAGQIESLLHQTYQDWCLFVHDDGSQDGTTDLLRRFADSHPDRITILDYPSMGGPCANFLSLLTRVDAPYYMFCDQDDVWLPEKIGWSMAELQKAERQHPDKGIVIHTDLQIVDEKLCPVSETMWHHAGICPQYIRSFSDSGGHTAIATGCTMLFNHKAKDSVACHTAGKALMHDSWVCLCTLREGGIVLGLDRPTVLYRQHGNNSLGAGSTSAADIGMAYRLRNVRKVISSNRLYYSMLCSLGYGSWLKYVLSKVKYKMRIRRGYY